MLCDLKDAGPAMLENVIINFDTIHNQRTGLDLTEIGIKTFLCDDQDSMPDSNIPRKSQDTQTGRGRTYRKTDKPTESQTHINSERSI
jgi:hypothetical protein